MSHRANFWLSTLAPEKLNASGFRILFFLCDHHNDEREPALACFPSQETLRTKTGLSNGALNNNLNQLEADGLIRRKKTTIPGTPERRTYYILGCDFAATQELTPEIGVSPNSTKLELASGQTPVSTGANSTLDGGKLQQSGEEPVRTGKEPSSPLSPDFKVVFDDVEFSRDDLEALLKAVGYDLSGHIPTPWLRNSATHIREWMSFGLTAAQIIEAARCAASRFTDLPATPQALKLAMETAASKPKPKQADPDAQRANWARAIKQGQRWAVTHITPRAARDLIKRGMVTEDECKAVGVHF